MTSALAMSRPAKMPGYQNTHDLDEAHSLSSEYSFAQPLAASTQDLFSFPQTEPSTDLLHAASWGHITEGAQNYQEFPDNGSSHSGEAEEYIVTSGQTTPRGTRLGHSRTADSTWAAAGLAPLSTGGYAMSRMDSSRSNGSLLSHTTHMSNMDIRGNAFRETTHANGTTNGVDSCLLLDADPAALQYWPGYNLGSGSGADSSAFSMSDPTGVHVVPSQIQFGPDMPENASPSSWVSFPGSVSRTSSPATIDEPWLQPQGPLSPPNSSPDISCQSPSVGFGSRMQNDDIPGMVLHDNMMLPTALGNRRDSETARNHDLYKNATPQEDGLFHCPWEGDPSCNHRPEKLKCNYDKFVDSHLKPYRCKDHSCEGARFSSTACLLRHEREAHGLHGHGDKPFLCHYEGCERGVLGNGFPRQWNLKDHMKRVHSDSGSSGTSSSGTNNNSNSNSTSHQTSKGRKRKTDGGSSHSTSNRKSVQKNSPPKENKPAVKPLLEQWMDHRKAIEETIRGLEKPSEFRTMQQITDMQKRLNFMAQMSNSMAQADLHHAPGPLGYCSTG